MEFGNMRVDLTKPRKAPTKFFEEYDYQSLILKDSDVDELIKIYSTHIETNDISIDKRAEYKLLFEPYRKILKLAPYCTDKNKIYYVDSAILNIKSNSNYSKAQIDYYYSYFNHLINSRKINDENDNLSDEDVNPQKEILERTDFVGSDSDYMYFDCFIVYELFEDMEDYKVINSLLKINYITLYTQKFNTIYDILKFLNLDASLNMPVKEYLKLMNGMSKKQIYNLVLQQLSRRYNKEWFYSNMPNTFETASETRTAFEIMMNFKYDGEISK